MSEQVKCDFCANPATKIGGSMGGVLACDEHAYWVTGPKRAMHHPACDTVLGPDFKVEPGRVVMTLFACTGGCWVEGHAATPTETEERQ